MRRTILACVCCCGVSIASADIRYEVVMLGGEPAPGLPGYRLGWFLTPSIDEAGNITVVASLLDEQNEPAGFGLWAGPPGNLKPIARSGDEAPGAGSVQILGERDWRAWVSGGYIIFSNRMESGRRGYFGGPLGGPMERIAMEGDAAIGGGTVSDLWSGSMHHSVRMQNGHIVYTAWVAPGTTRGSTVFAGPMWDAEVVAQQGQDAPGLEPGATFGRRIGGRPAITSEGTAYFGYEVEAPGGAREVIWRWGPTTVPGEDLSPVVQAGEAAPTFPGGTFVGLRWPVPDSNGGLTFSGSVAPSPSPAPSISAQWYGSAGRWERVLAAGDPAPGAPGMSFTANNHVYLNRRGEFVLSAALSEPGLISGRSIVMGTAGDLRVRWGAGHPAPGTEYGFSEIDPPTINDSGQIAFTALASGPAPPPHGGGPYVLWGTRRDRLLPVAVTGHPLEIAPGTVRMVHAEQWLHIWGGGTNDGSPRSLNNRGELVFALSFADGPAAVLIADLGDESCYANCDGSRTEPLLTVDDFVCFVAAFAEAQSLPHHQQVVHYANCDGSTTAPVLTADDFLCFIDAFTSGCP